MATRHHHDPIRPAVIDVIARAEAAAEGDPLTDEAYFLRQLRAALATETPLDQLLERYGARRDDRLGRLYARYGD